MPHRRSFFSQCRWDTKQHRYLWEISELASDCLDGRDLQRGILCLCTMIMVEWLGGNAIVRRLGGKGRYGMNELLKNSFE